jgi:creatinine amidohydrolase
MSDITTDVQVELLLPHEIDDALARRSVVYIPLGSIEYHSRHLPVGLDGLNAHGVCIRAAARTGGIVLPVLYYGFGGGHTSYPWTIMANSGPPLSDLLDETLRRLASFEVKVAVLFTGHFSDEQLALIDELADRWNTSRPSPKTLALSVNRTDARTAPDHAGISRQRCFRRCGPTECNSTACRRCPRYLRIRRTLSLATITVTIPRIRFGV